MWQPEQPSSQAVATLIRPVRAAVAAVAVSAGILAGAGIGSPSVPAVGGAATGWD